MDRPVNARVVETQRAVTMYRSQLAELVGLLDVLAFELRCEVRHGRQVLIEWERRLRHVLDPYLRTVQLVTHFFDHDAPKDTVIILYVGEHLGEYYHRVRHLFRDAVSADRQRFDERECRFLSLLPRAHGETTDERECVRDALARAADETRRVTGVLRDLLANLVVEPDVNSLTRLVPGPDAPGGSSPVRAPGR